MKLLGLHLLLTYECNFECDHCFVWGSPWQNGTMTLEKILEILKQGKDLQTVKKAAFRGFKELLFNFIADVMIARCLVLTFRHSEAKV